MSDVQDDVFYEVLTDALNISDGATIGRLDPERRRLVVGLNGFVTELAMWTGTDPAMVKEHLGCTKSDSDLLFREQLSVLQACHSYLALSHEVCFDAPEPRVALDCLVAVVEVFRRSGRDVELCRAAVEERSALTSSTARELIFDGDVPGALAHALGSNALGKAMVPSPMSRDDADRIANGVLRELASGATAA